MARLLYNLLSATLDADITNVATTVTFTGPLKEFGTTNIATIAGPDTLTLKVGYELMHVTAYTSGASTATVTRGVEGSTATAHNEGDVLRHVQTADDLPDLSAYAPLASPTFTGEPVAPSFKATGKTGATATPIRLAGGTAAGAPASGAHLKGEIVFDDAGVGYYCTVAGTPGTWVSFGGGGGGGSVATDAIWDAAGDLVYGTGADMAARLPVGAALRVLRVNAGATAPEWADLSGIYLPLTQFKRQGGSSTVWATAGTTNQTITGAPLIQVGAYTFGATGSQAITFPTAYSQAPHVLVSFGDPTVNGRSVVRADSITSSGFSLILDNATSGSATATVRWFAIGQ